MLSAHDVKYWVTQKLPQIYTANHATFPIQIGKITVQICGNFWVTKYRVELDKLYKVVQPSKQANMSVPVSKPVTTTIRAKDRYIYRDIEIAEKKERYCSTTLF